MPGLFSECRPLGWSGLSTSRNGWFHRAPCGTARTWIKDTKGRWARMHAYSASSTRTGSCKSKVHDKLRLKRAICEDQTEKYFMHVQHVHVVAVEPKWKNKNHSWAPSRWRLSRRSAICLIHQAVNNFTAKLNFLVSFIWMRVTQTIEILSCFACHRYWLLPRKHNIQDKTMNRDDPFCH